MWLEAPNSWLVTSTQKVGSDEKQLYGYAFVIILRIHSFLKLSSH